jgi:hypothetical protein
VRVQETSAFRDRTYLEVPGNVSKRNGSSVANSHADISPHRPLNGAVVLHPVHPRGIPDRWEVHRAIANHQVFSIAQLSAKNEVADSSQRVGATVTFRSREEMAVRFELRIAGV